MERLLDEVSFEAPTLKKKQITVNAQYVKAKLEGILKNEDLAKFIL